MKIFVQACMSIETNCLKVKAASSSPHQCCNELAKIYMTFVPMGIFAPSPPLPLSSDVVTLVEKWGVVH
jgi:hypothetical protein